MYCYKLLGERAMARCTFERQVVEPQRDLPAPFQAAGARGRQRVHPDRLDHRASAAAQRWRKGEGYSQGIGRSRGGLSTKIRAAVDALGNPTGFHLTPRQAHDLEGADVLLADTKAQTVIADKSHGAQARVVELLLSQSRGVAIALAQHEKEGTDL